MDLIDRLRDLSNRVERQSDNVGSEETTKTSFVLPLLQALSCIVLNLTRLLRESLKRGLSPDNALITREEFLKPLQLSQTRLANAIGVPPRRINEIVLGKRAVSADTAVRLAQHFGTSEKFWMGLQADYDLEEVHRQHAA